MSNQEQTRACERVTLTRHTSHDSSFQRSRTWTALAPAKCFSITETHNTTAAPTSWVRNSPTARLTCIVTPLQHLLPNHFKASTTKCDPGRTRTCNLWFRRPTPYPLGHRAIDRRDMLLMYGRQVSESCQGVSWKRQQPLHEPEASQAKA